jgi:hypothetical protein
MYIEKIINMINYLYIDSYMEMKFHI